MSSYSLYSVYIYIYIYIYTHEREREREREREYRFPASWLVRSFDSNLPQVIPRTGPLFSSTFLTQNVLEISPPLSIHFFSITHPPSLPLSFFLSLSLSLSFESENVSAKISIDKGLIRSIERSNNLLEARNSAKILGRDIRQLFWISTRVAKSGDGRSRDFKRRHDQHRAREAIILR